MPWNNFWWLCRKLERLINKQMWDAVDLHTSEGIAGRTRMISRLRWLADQLEQK